MSGAEQAIDEQFGAKIRACRHLYDYAKSLTKDWPGRRLENTADGLIGALLSRSLDTFMAAVELACKGYGAQASMLNRSLFEDMIDAHWVATHPETAEQCYRDHYQHSRMLLADAVAKYPDYYPDIELPEFGPAERKKPDDGHLMPGTEAEAAALLDRFLRTDVREAAATVRQAVASA